MGLASTRACASTSRITGTTSIKAESRRISFQYAQVPRDAETIRMAAMPFFFLAGRLRCSPHELLVAIAVFLATCVPVATGTADDKAVYGVECWEAGSVFADPACSCLGGPAHPKLGSRPTVRVIVGSWYARQPLKSWPDKFGLHGLGV